jgi:hypothetical protein
LRELAAGETAADGAHGTHGAHGRKREERNGPGKMSQGEMRNGRGPGARLSGLAVMEGRGWSTWEGARDGRPYPNR